MEGQDYTHYVRQDVNSLKIMNTEEMRMCMRMC